MSPGSWQAAAIFQACVPEMIHHHNKHDSLSEVSAHCRKCQGATFSHERFRCQRPWMRCDFLVSSRIREELGQATLNKRQREGDAFLPRGNPEQS